MDFSISSPLFNGLSKSPESETVNPTNVAVALSLLKKM